MNAQRILVVTGDHRQADATKWSGGYSPDDLALHREMREAFESLQRWKIDVCSDHSELLDRLRREPPDLVVNFCDTGWGNVATQELHVPAALEILGIPYTGAGPAGMVLCYDKSLVRMIAGSVGVPVPAECVVEHNADLGALELPLEFPALIKPAQGDGSVGINRGAIVHSADEARRQLTWLRAEIPRCRALVQEYLPGAEYGLALVGNPGTLRPLPMAQVDFSKLASDVPKILAFESKTGPENPYDSVDIVPASVDSQTLEMLVKHASALFARLECRDYARFDWRTSRSGEIKLMEVNPNPAWSKAAKLARMAAMEQLSYPDLLATLVDSAIKRYTA